MMKTTQDVKRYHATKKATDWYLNSINYANGSYEVPDDKVEEWANDPNCIEKEACAKALVERRRKREEAEIKRQAQAAAERPPS